MGRKIIERYIKYEFPIRIMYKVESRVRTNPSFVIEILDQITHSCTPFINALTVPFKEITINSY